MVKKINQKTMQKLHLLFIEHGFIVVEQSDLIIKYVLRNEVITLICNPVENSNILWVGKMDSLNVEIDDEIMREHFRSALKLSDLPLEGFIDNVFLFFMTDGKALLSGDQGALIDLQKFSEIRSSRYTRVLQERQNIESANLAWKDGKYSDVVKYLEKVDENNLSESLRMKYVVARKKTNS